MWSMSSFFLWWKWMVFLKACIPCKEVTYRYEKMCTSKCLDEKVSFLSTLGCIQESVSSFFLSSKILFPVNAIKNMRSSFKNKIFILLIFRIFWFSKNQECTIKWYLAREYCDWGYWGTSVILEKWKKNVKTTEGRDPGQGLSILG